MENLFLACAVGDIAWLKRSLSRDVDPAAPRNKEGLSPLQLAAKNGHLECVRYLLDNYSICVDDAAPSTGQTALHLSISTQHGVKSLQCMKLLLERGADQNKCSTSGEAALHFAAKKGHVKCLKRLLEHGADINIQDNTGRNACEMATLYGHYECVRLLRALHWAKGKDDILTSKLQTKAAKQRRDKQQQTVQAQQQRLAADHAYQSWAEKKPNPTIPPPAACRERQTTRSQPNTPHSCQSCSRGSSRAQSAGQQEEPHVRRPVSVTMEQVRRNTETTGKPDKMHPYTNHSTSRKRSAKQPRKQTVRHNQVRHKSRGSTKSSPTPTATPSLPPTNTTTTTTSFSPTTDSPCNISIEYQSEETEKQVNTYEFSDKQTHTTSEWSSTADECSKEKICDTPEQDEYSPPCELNLAFLRNTATQELDEEEISEEDENRVTFLVGGARDDEEDEEEEEEEEDDEDDLPFHDVGVTNTFEALSLPSSMTKNRTPAEIMQLLRSLGNSTSKKYHKSKSHYFRRPSLTNRLQRRFSLGSIPEGRMVTNYSGDSISSMETEIRYIDIAWSEDSRTQQEDEEREDGGEGEWSQSIFETEEPEEGGEESLKGEANSEDKESERERDYIENEDLQSSPSVESQLEPSSGTSMKQPTLNIINFSWDSASNSVQTRVTKSSMVPANHPLQGRVPRSRPVTISSCRRRSLSPKSSSSSPSSQGTTSPRSFPSPRRGESANPSLSKQTNGYRDRQSSSPRHAHSPSSSLSSLKEITAVDNSTSNNNFLLPPSSPNHSPKQTSLDVPSFPAHSLFGSMGGLASKSMILLSTPSPLLTSDPAEPLSSAEPCPQPKMKRRIHSAPNLHRLALGIEARPLKTSVFTYGGTLK